MKNLTFVFLSALLTGAFAHAQTGDISAVVRDVQRYDYTQPRAPLFALDDHAARVTGDAAAQKAFAALLASALRDPASTPLARILFCQKLAAVGTDAEVPLLAGLLKDPQLYDAARLALEGMRSPAADAALRDALAWLDGRPLLGVIQSIGARRDAAAVPALASFLKQPERASAAALALAAIATPAAVEALRGTDFSDAKLRCARQLVAAGDAKAALALCRPLLAGDQPADRRLSALATLAPADSPEIRAVLVAAFTDADDLVAAGAIRLAIGSKNSAITTALADALARAAANRSVLLLDALGERGDGAAATAVVGRVKDPDDAVAMAAISALGILGDERHLGPLLDIAATAKGARKTAAEEALAVLGGEKVDAAICAGIAQGSSDARRAMMAAARMRNLEAAIPALLKAAGDPEAAIRVASAQALARIGRPGDYAALVRCLAAARDEATCDAWSDAVTSVGRRLKDSSARIAPLRDALAATPAGIPRSALIRSLAPIGGAEALAIVAPLAASSDPATADVAVRTLAAWPDVSAAETLHGVVAQGSDPVHRALALRGILRLVAGDASALMWIERIRPHARTADEKRALLGAIATLKQPGALDLALGSLADAEVKAEAALAAVEIGKQLVRSHADQVEAAMARVLAEAKDTAGAAELLAQARGAQGANVRQQRARRDVLTAALPPGSKLASYLDCGAATSDSGPGGVSLRVDQGRAYHWPVDGGEVDSPAMTVAFDARQVCITASGLNPARNYALGFTWWDHDNNGRVQSVSADGQVLVEKSPLPAWHGRQQSEVSQVKALPPAITRDGKVEVRFQAEGAGNAVVSEVWIVETGAAPAAAPVAIKPSKRALIVTGMEYPGHKWRETAPFLRDVLTEDARIDVTINEDAKAALESPSLGSNDVIVLNYMNWEHPGPGAAAQEGLRKAVENGTGLVLVHFACGAFQSWPEFVKIAGRVWNPKFRGHDPRGPFRVNIVDAQHEITKGFAAFDTDDELYTCLDGDTPIHVLADANSKVDKKDYPMAFVLQYGKGRVFMSTLGHDVRALAFPDVKNLYRRATAWAAQLPPGS